jgi:hypothetical protein
MSEVTQYIVRAEFSADATGASVVYEPHCTIGTFLVV